MKPIKNEPRMSNDARIAVLETSIININATLLDLKHDINRGFDKINERFEKIDERFEKIDLRFEKVEERFEKFDQRFEKMESKFDAKFDRLENRLWSNFLWLLGAIFGLAGLIAHAQHWI